MFEAEFGSETKESSNDHEDLGQSPWNPLELLSTRFQTDPGARQDYAAGPEKREPSTFAASGAAGAKDQSACPGGDCSEGNKASSFSEKMSEVIGKIGQFLQSVLPPEYAQYVQQYLPMAEQFLGNLLNSASISDGQNGAKRLNLDLNESKTIPGVVSGEDLQVGPKLGFDMRWTGAGADLTNIAGLKVGNADVRSARLDINGGEPTINVSVVDKDGQTREISVPVPIQELIGSF